MKYRHVLVGVVAAASVAAAVPLAGQVPQAGSRPADPTKSWTQPRTAWGDPDLQGIWRDESLPFERPNEFAGREFLTDAEVAERLALAQERQSLALAGKSTFRGFRAQENYNAIFNTSAEPPKITRRTSAIIDPPNGRLPAWTLEQVKRWDAREAATAGRGEAASWEDMNAGGRCLPVVAAPQVPAWGLGFGGENTPYGGRDAEGKNLNLFNGDGISPTVGGGAGGARRILQAPGYVVMLREEAGEYVTIPLNGRPAPSPQRIRQWTGIPRGRWDGNTLVVEYTNIRYGYPLIPSSGFPLYPGNAETLKLTERYTRTGPDSIEYRYTVDDPGVYVRPYTVLHGLGRDDDYIPAPDLCHENNRDMGGVLANQRADEFLSLETGNLSMEMRRPRVEKLRREAEEAVRNKQGSR